MGRHTKGAAYVAPAAASEPHTGTTATNHHIEGPKDERSMRLRAFLRTRQVPSGAPAEAVELVTEAIVSDPSEDDRNNGRRFQVAVAALLYDLRIHGNVDAKRAFAPTALDRFVRIEHGRDSVGTASTLRSDLRRLGRHLCPEQTPARGTGFARAKASAPTTPTQLRELWALSRTLPPATGRRLSMALACCAGVGARPEEARLLTSGDIVHVRTRHGEGLCVNVHRPSTGVVRTVPVLGAHATEVLRRAMTDPADSYLLAGSGQRRNVLNHIRADVRLRGANLEFSARALRHAWICSLASACVPTAVLLELADIGDTKLLSDLRPYVRRFDTAEAVRLVQEAY